MSFSTEMIFSRGCSSRTPPVIISAIVRKAGTGSDDAVDDLVRADLRTALAGQDVDVDRQVVLLDGGPERVPHRVVVAPLGQRVVRDEDAAEAQLLDAVQLAEVRLGIGHRDVGDGEQALGRVRGVLGGPVVVGAVSVALELLVGMAEQRHAVAAVEDLGAEAVDVHVLQPLDGVPAAGSAHRVAATRELLEVLGRNAGAAEAGRVERPQRIADQEVAGLAVELVLQVRRAVAEPGLHARGPQIRWLEDVRVGGKDPLHHEWFPL